MKGILHKTEKGWVVEHEVAEKTPIGYKTWWGTFTLHPADHRDYVLDNNGYFYFYDGKEVEFEFVTEWENGQVGVNGLTYAKLIHHPVDTNKMIDHIGEVNKMVCVFEPRIDTSSATICKWCGQEKFLHNQVPDVRKMVEDDVEKLAEKYPYGGREGSKRLAFIDGYNTAKETLYTEQQTNEKINLAIKEFERLKSKANSLKDVMYLDGVLAVLDGIKNQSLKKH